MQEQHNCPDLDFSNILNMINHTVLENTTLQKQHQSDSDYNTGVPFALSNGGVYKSQHLGSSCFSFEQLSCDLVNGALYSSP